MGDWIDAVGKEMRYRKKDFAELFASVLAGWMFGIAILWIIMHAAGEKGWFNMGLLMGCIICVTMITIVAFSQTTAMFDLALSMGCRRKIYYWANLTTVFLEGLFCLGVVVLLGRLETWMFADEIAAAGVKEFLSGVERYGVPAILALCAVCNLLGLLVHHFGRWIRIILVIMLVLFGQMMALMGNALHAGAGTVLSGVRFTLRNAAAWLTLPHIWMLAVITAAAAAAAGRIVAGKAAAGI